MRLPSHLQLRHRSVFYFRRAVPDDLRGVCQRREIKVSLRTGDRREAIRLGRLLTYKVDTVFSELRDAMAKKKPIQGLGLGIKGARKNPDGSVSFDSIETDPAKPDEEAKAFEAIVNALQRSGADASGNGVHDSATADAKESASLRLSRLTAVYCDERLRANRWTPKTEQESRASFELLQRILGDTAPAQVSRQQAAGVKDTLKSLPPRIGTDPLLKARSIEDILRDKPSTTLAVRTINKHLDHYSSLFRWAENHGYIERNPFEGLKIKEKRSSADQRQAFTNDDLHALFSTRVHASLRYQHAYQYWLPLLGLYTGARLNELCQLHLDDLYYTDDVPVVDINAATDDKHLKNAGSQRLLPIHSALLDYGLLRYVDRLRESGKARLFPELRWARDGYTKNPSRWFNTRHMPNCGIKADGKVFHSFRHTFATALKRNNVPESHANALLGHQDATISYNTYGKDHRLAGLAESVEKLDFSDALTHVQRFMQQ